MDKPILVFQTDFTYKEGAVCAMYGVVKSVDRSLEIFDGTHEIPHFDIWSASYRLNQSMQFWPKGTIFVSVVDPGVGTSRRACVAKTCDGYIIVTPDNGTLTHVKAHAGIQEVREIDETRNRLKSTEGTSVFHGRDLFGYCAARLASGIITYEEVGPGYPVEEIVVYPIIQPTLSQNRAEGIFEINDPNFGNLWTNIPAKAFMECGFALGDMVDMTIRHGDKVVHHEKALFAPSFGYVKKGETVIYNNELMNIGVATCMGSFCETWHVDYGSDWTVTFQK
jgi:hypothetical protein